MDRAVLTITLHFILLAFVLGCAPPQGTDARGERKEEREVAGEFEPETVLIPEGSFLMGTSAEQGQRILNIGGSDWETYLKWQQPQHSVNLSAYHIGKYPVTNAQYAVFTKESGQTAPAHWSASLPADAELQHPVGNIRWSDAIAYCEWLAKRTRKPYRLPTEAEWEKAARGDDGRFYPWGNDWDPTRLNSREAGPGSLTEVGMYSPGGDSPYGVADMSGQLWEWVADWFDGELYANRSGTVRDPDGPHEGKLHVLRGGAFNLDGFLLGHTAVRDYHEGLDVAIDDGFRVALSVGDRP